MPRDAESFGSPKAENPVLERHRREILRIRRSGAFRLGAIFTAAASRPWRLLWLPWSILTLFWKIILERVGRREYSSEEPGSLPMGTRRSIIFFPTNGVGFGHFTRLFAIAKRVKRIDPKAEVIFLTTMPTLHLLENEDFPAYHLPGRKKFDSMDARTWNMLVEDLMSSVFSVHSPKLFVFDGAFPYRGMLNGIKGVDEMGKIWLRRGTLRQDSASIPNDSLDHFDVILQPKDSIEEQRPEELEHSVVQCDPIIFADEDMLMSRELVRSRLGIPADSLVAYVQLGAGRINDIESDISITLAELAKHENVYTVLGESMIGERLDVKGDRLRILRDYPNSLLFNGFDFAIMAGGYNSFHEVVKFGLPTLCYPNLNTGKDNQLARVEVAEEVGCMIVMRDFTKTKVSLAIERLLDEDVRNEMRINASALSRPNGADQIAQFLLDRMDQ